MNEPAVDVCVITYKRPKQLLKTLGWIRDRTIYENYKVHVVIDYEEKEETLGCLAGARIQSKFMFDKRAECVKATNKCYTTGIAPYFVYLSDDMEVEPNWLREAMRCMQTFPDKSGLVVFKDGIQNGGNACAGLVSREYVKTRLGGSLFNPQYIHYCGDTELYRRSKLMDKIKYCPSSVVWHLHWQAQPAHRVVKDAIYTDSLPVWPGDRVILAARTKEGFK